MSEPINIYEMYGRQEERHVQEFEELEAALEAAATLLRSLKDGSLKVEDIEFETNIEMPSASMLVESAEASTNGKAPKAASPAGRRGRSA